MKQYVLKNIARLSGFRLAFHFLVAPLTALAQDSESNQQNTIESRSIHKPGAERSGNLMVHYVTSDISLDGVLDEAAWKTADAGDNFWQYFPTDSARSINSTQFKFLYNDKYIYIGIQAGVASNNYVVSSLRRDFSGGSNDNVTIMFDTFKNGTTAFLFGMTPYGVQREVFVSGGGSDRNGFNVSWDQKWFVKSKMYEDHYTLEAAIPFSSIKFREGDKTWRVQCYRWDMQTNEQSAWNKVPQNQMLSSLAFMREIEFEKPLNKSRTPFTVIPYINSLGSKDYESGEIDGKFKFGGDAKIAIGNSLNLDVTVNPDFSNVEVDNIFTNLTRFEVFLPEKRQFFIDNNDLFGNYGDAYNAAKPFFSRRVGLAKDTAGNLIENRIIGGVRLSGNLSDKWRLGFLNMQTFSDTDNEIPSNNDMMFSLQRKLFSRSNIGIFGVNRETFGDYEFLNPANKYNRVFGMDYNLASSDNSWTGKFYLHKSFQPNDNQGNLSSQATVTLNKRKFTWIADLMYVDEDFRADLGFVPRVGIFKNGNGFSYNFYPKKGKISYHTPGGMALFYWRPDLDFRKTDHTYRLYYNVNFTNQATLELSGTNQYIFLTKDFDPTRSQGAIPLPGSQGYTFNQAGFDYQSNPAKVFSYRIAVSGGEFFNGNNLTANSNLAFRIQPWVLLNLDVQYDAIRLPEPYANADYWLIAPKVDITFNKSLFWSTLIQYSNQRENLGINSRLQWRYAPMSDIYLVYNDSYDITNFGPRFRSINLKVTYWLNI